MRATIFFKGASLTAAVLFFVIFCGVNSVAAKNAADADTWQYEFTLYGWFPSLDSTLKYPDPGGDVSVDASDILDSLNFIFMGTLEAQKNKLSFGLDVIYLDLSNSKNTNIQIGPGTGLNVNAGLGIKSWVVTGIVGYEVAQSEKNRTAVIGGFRFLDLSADVDIPVTGPPPPTPPPAYLSGSEDFWDIIIGFKGTYMLNEKWYIPYYADIGVGQSKFT